MKGSLRNARCPCGSGKKYKKCCGAATETSAFNAAQALGLAVQHHRRGNLLQAEAIYRQVLQAQPNHPDALHLLGVNALHGGNHATAENLIRQALRIKPAEFLYHNNLGGALLGQGRLDEAKACFEQTLKLKPDFPDAHYNLGCISREQGRIPEAAQCFERALELNPDYPEAHNNLGAMLYLLGQIPQAMRHYQLALALTPQHAEAHKNLGDAFQQLERFDDAVTQYDRALALRPGYADAMNNLGDALRSLGKLPEAMSRYARALAFSPESAHPRSSLINLKQTLCDWSGLDDLIVRQSQAIRSRSGALASPFFVLCASSSYGEQLACAQDWAARQVVSAGRPPAGTGFRFLPGPRTRLHIGYLSADFHEHATAYLIAEMLELHDRSAFEVSAYSYGPDDGSPMQRRLVSACDRFVDIRAMSFLDAATRIHRDQIDILVDLKGYTRSARTQIVALRPAPIQVNYLGYPGTMGAEFIDYLVTDRCITPPQDQEFFTERFVYLPDCYQVNDRKRAVSANTPTRVELGLPSEGFVFCSFNNSYKITREVFDSWMRILRQVAGSVLWLLEGNSWMGVNLRREAEARGVTGNRLVFARPVDLALHLARIAAADLFLDTLPYNAHTTASDALWAGLPLLTCTGKTFSGRVAASLLNAVRLPELITESLPEYEARAIQLANHPDELRRIRAKLAANRLATPLFDSARFTRHLERAYRMMWERYVSGQNPDQIKVPEISAP